MTNEELIKTLKKRFLNNMHRHNDITWVEITTKLNDIIIKSLKFMEETKGEPDILKYNNELFFFDFSKETPDRKSLCYDDEALDSRKSFKPVGSALTLAKQNNIELLSEEEYYFLQSVEKVDLKTSSWIKTDNNIRKLGGALFADRRFDRTFIYHNTAESYYSNRGFRGKIKI
ncbi:MAG: DUF4256 domain-containing protein [Bacilli bacterium]|nr:DUF4256 domain-containing protein [Bacilli bacterium]